MIFFKDYNRGFCLCDDITHINPTIRGDIITNAYVQSFEPIPFEKNVAKHFMGMNEDCAHSPRHAAGNHFKGMRIRVGESFQHYDVVSDHTIGIPDTGLNATLV